MTTPASDVSFTQSGTNLLVQFNHGSASESWVHFNFDIEGALQDYAKA